MKLIFSPARLVVIISISLLVFGSCKKETSADTTQEEFASQASSEADAESDDIYNEVFDNVMGVNADVAFGGTGVFARMNPGTSGVSARLESCPTVTITRLNGIDLFPAKIVMDFGSGCTARDGRYRSGKIISIYTNRLTVPGAKATTTFDNYRVDSTKVEGTLTITNQSDAPTNPNCLTHKWKATVENGRLSKPNGNYTEWDCTKNITQIEGTCTPFVPLDDIYRIEGSSNGKVKRNDLLIAWRAETTDPLIKKFSCRWLVKGTLKIMRLNLATNSPWVATINYGTGDCDNKAVVVINGVSHNITLP